VTVYIIKILVQPKMIRPSAAKNLLWEDKKIKRERQRKEIEGCIENGIETGGRGRQRETEGDRETDREKKNPSKAQLVKYNCSIFS
jgi:hypothetical protein